MRLPERFLVKLSGVRALGEHFVDSDKIFGVCT